MKENTSNGSINFRNDRSGSRVEAMKILGTLTMLDLTVIQSLTPLIKIDQVDEILIVRNTKGPNLPKVRYYCPPKILIRFFPIRILSKFILMVYLIIREKPKFVISYYMKFSGGIALMSAKLFNIPVNLNVMSGPQEFQLLRIWRKDYRLQVMEKFLLYLTKHFDGVTTTGTRTKDYLLRNGVKNNVIDVLPTSVDVDRFHPMPVEKDYDIVAVGRFDPVKKFDSFLQIVAKVKTTKPNIKVALVGDGPLTDYLEKLACELHLQNNVEFTGYQDTVEVYYNAARVFVLTSEREGLPMAMLEAMGCGLPCVVSNVGNILDIAVNGINSIVVEDYDDIDTFVQSILKLLDDREFYMKLSVNARRSVTEHYSYENATKTWQKILNSV